MPFEVLLSDVEIMAEDIPGWVVTSSGNITVALDINISEELRNEGFARELVNKIQNLRKDKGFDVVDRIELDIQKHAEIVSVVNNNFSYICSEILADKINIVEELPDSLSDSIELSEEILMNVSIRKAK
jgi:isoleucyl-tRNA synthetase